VVLRELNRFLNIGHAGGVVKTRTLRCCGVNTLFVRANENNENVELTLEQCLQLKEKKHKKGASNSPVG
jgi:hypothetical protein